MAGFIQDPIQFVNLIADNLRDRYPLVPDEPGGPPSGFPVFKELIQNTDDSQASELRFGRAAGLPAATHPLLKAPALFFVNNGYFSDSDARGICSFGQNSKAADQASIGKFGLGMKSVFHFCEAFFFLAHDGDRAYAKVLNPWSGEASSEVLHQDWDDFASQDARAIREHLSAVTTGFGAAEQLFILWIPLRRKADLAGAGAIIGQYPGDEDSLLAFLAMPNFPLRAAGLLPMLRHLERVAYWDLGAATGASGSVFEVELAGGAERPSLLPPSSSSSAATASNPGRRLLTGRIDALYGETEQSMGFSGQEAHAWNPDLDALHRHQRWPSSYVRDRDGHASEAKDKAQPHGAVIFSRTPGRGRLVTHWTVFLPLDEIKAVQTVSCKGDDAFRLTLHGYFFVDAGRQHVDGLEDCGARTLDPDESEAALRRAWNCEVLRSNVLPLLIPALDAFCAEQGLSDESKTALSQALLETSLVSRFRAAITEESGWLREITPKGIAWVNRGTERKVLRLPARLEDDPGRAWRLFPALASVCEDYWLAVEGAPSIVHPSAEAQWNEEQLVALIGSVAPRELFQDIKLLKYLNSFLEGSAGPYLGSLSVKSALADLVRKGLIQLGEEGLAQQKRRVARIVGWLNPAHCFKIDNGLPGSLLRRLLSADVDALPLPAKFLPEKTPDNPTPIRGDAELSVSDAARFLTAVDKALRSTSDSDAALLDSALKLSPVLIKGVPLGQRPQLLQRCADLRVLGGFDCAKGRRLPLSVQEIQAAAKAGTLFGTGEARAPLGFAVELQRVLPHERVLVINKETASLALNTEGAIAHCDGHAVLRSVGMKPRILGGLEERATLADLAHVPSGEEEIRGLRFLLHADPEHFHDEDTLWVLGRKQAPVWQKLWSQLVGGADKPWNLLEGLVADALSRREWDTVDIHEISAQSVLDEIERQGTSALDPSVFDQDECEQILKEVRDGDDALWCSLPFHSTRKEAPVSGAADNAYLDLDRVSLPEEMLRGVYLIRLSNDAVLAQRQKRLLKPLDEQAAIRIALDHADVPDRWRVILDALDALDRQGKGPPPDLQKDIRTTEWLSIADGDVAKPEDVIDLDAADEEIDRVLAREPGAFVTPRTLATAIDEHPFFPKLRETYVARGKEGLGQLGAALEALDAYQIGGVRFDDAGALAESAQVLGEHPNAGWQLLSTLIGKMGAEECFEALLSGMTGVIPVDSVVDLLSWIAERGGDEARLVRVFNRYLEVFAQDEVASSVVGRLKLRNQESRWRPSAELVSGVTGVARGHVLDSDQARILGGLIFHERPGADLVGQADSIAYASETSSAGPILRDYFDPWTGRVASPLVGVFVLLFGGDKSVKDLCRDLLGQHSRDWLMSQVPWESPRSDTATARKAWLQGFTLERALDHFRIAVRVHEGETLSVRSILGEPVKVALDEQFTNLFLGRPSYFRLDEGDGYRIELVLRRIKTANCSDAQLSGYLKSSTVYLLREVFNQHRPDLDALWNDLGRSDQVDIELAKALMLDNIPFYLKQLGTHKHPALRDGLERFRKNERREKEFGKQPKAEEYRRRKEQALRDLQQLIESDERAQRAILDSVQRKIKDFQYQPESVPFELFQNADDALRNLELIDAYPAKPGDLDVDELPAGIRRFVIEGDTNQISFMHWGRAINQFGSRGFPGRELGFDRDLENMLILSASDKGEDVTGKFGLGFKSVWLVSDRPTIVSGRLQAVIVGGVLPVANHGRITQGLVSRLAARQPDRRWAGTAIHLPLLGEVSEDALLDRFCSVAGAMVAFSRSLRTVEVQRSNGRGFSASWEPRVVRGIDGIQMGRIRQGDGDPLLAMKISLGEGALLLAVGPSGFVELPKTIPSLWVTAPIREQERLGFAVNAMFEIDAGRSRLSAEVAQNEERAKRLGKQLAKELDRLRAGVAGRWDKVAGSMELATSAGPYDFWHSLWRILMSRLPQLERESGSRVVATALLGEGLRDLAEAHEVVPNGLPKGFQRLIRSTEAKTVLRGALSNPVVLGVVANASCFRSWLDFEFAVSSDMATWLRLLIPSLSQQTDRLQSISLAQLIVQLDRRREVSPDDAFALGEALHSKTLEAWDKAGEEVSPETVKDFKAAAEKAGDLSFLSAGGSVKRCTQLLSDRGSEDEKRRWAFAPVHARLSDRYRDEGEAFFLWCRDKLEAPADKLKEWVIQAADADRREAALRYLLAGDLALQVVQALHEKGFAGSWLASVDEESDLLSDWDAGSRWRLVYQILKTPEESRSAFQNAGGGEEEQEPEPIDPEVALERIYQWWIQEREEHLERYRRSTYPEGHPPNLKDDDVGNIERSSWLLVLLLGGFHTMGRVLPGQHRTFIEGCQRRGWWTVFTDPNPVERFEDWMGVLDQYIDQQVDQQDYEQWMMRFPIIYKLSRHLDEYAELLLQLKYVPAPFDLAAKLTSWSDPDQQGGGIGAAALPRTLGIGANFVIRELIRLGVIDSPQLRQHAFVPYRRVRRLIAEMGCPDAESTEPRLRISPVISGFLHEHMEAEKASFCGDFDIPLRIVAEDWELQQELLGRQLSFDDFGWVN